MNDSLECHVDPINLPLFWKATLLILYSLVGVASLAGNIIVILIVLSRRPLQTVPNTFICSLSIADIIITASSLWATPLYYYLKTWLLGKTMCYVVYAVQGASLMWVSYTLTGLAIDRYQLVASPFRQSVSMFVCYIIIAVTWLGAFVVLFPMLYHVSYIELPCHQFCFEDWRPRNEYRLYYGIAVLVARSGIPLVVIAWCNWQIAKRLNAQRKRFCGSNRIRQTEVCRKQRLQNILKAMVIVFAVSSFPLDLFNVLQDFSILLRRRFFSETQGDLIFLFSHWTAMSGTLLNPLIYAYWNENFRKQAMIFVNRQKESLSGILESLLTTSVPSHKSSAEAPAVSV